MAKPKTGNTVKIHYTGKLQDGTVFDSSKEREPLEFAIGKQQVIPGVEQAVTEMETGDTKTVTVTPEEGYGDYRDDLVLPFNADQIPEDVDAKPGVVLQLQSQDGQKTAAVIKKIEGDTVYLDANHPLAGQTLIFELELVEIN